MTKANREPSISATLKWEGGYCNDAADPGGPTNWGITIADAQKYWKKNATAADVRSMPKDIAIDIYRSKYWKTSFYDCDKLAPGIDLAVFDFGVNSGPARAKKYLDQVTKGGLQKDVDTINKYYDAREGFLRSLSTFPVFGNGWLNRTRDLRKISLKMASAPITQAEAAKNAGGTAAVTAAGYGVWLKWGFIGLGVAGVLAVAAYIAYRVYKDRHNELAKAKTK